MVVLVVLGDIDGVGVGISVAVLVLVLLLSLFVRSSVIVY